MSTVDCQSLVVIVVSIVCLEAYTSVILHFQLDVGRWDRDGTHLGNEL